jgi:hypothetical protein
VRDKLNTFYIKSRTLIGKIELKSAVKIGLLLFPVIVVFQLLLTSGSDSYSKKIIPIQAEQLSAINSLQSPADMKPGIVNSETRYVIDSTADTVNEITNKNSGLLCPAGMTVSIPYGYSCIKTKSNLSNIEKLLSRYSATITPALNFLEYNPEVDFSNYSRGASNTTDRIKYFKKGVETTIDEYKNIGFKNDSTKAIIALLEESMVAIEELEKNDDVNQFSNTITDAQNDIIKILEADYVVATNSARQSSITILKEFN